METHAAPRAGARRLVRTLVVAALVGSSAAAHAENRDDPSAPVALHVSTSTSTRAALAPAPVAVGAPLAGVVAAVVDVGARARHRLAPALRGDIERSPFHVLRCSPVLGVPNSFFGVRRDPFRKRRKKMHKGIDFSAERHTPVHAAAVGRVIKARRWGSYGRIVVIDHGGGVTTRYAHLQRIEVRRGDYVAPGTIIGRVGSSGRTTGPHLHFEVRQDGRAVDPFAAFVLGRIDRRGPLGILPALLEPGLALE